MEKKICWQKWVDPLGSNIDEVEFPGYGKTISPNDVPYHDGYGDDDEEEDLIHVPKPMRVMHTPFGFLSLTEHALATNKFDFWEMHTNFDITDDVESIISNTPGVETLDVLTRYRARIGFPKSGLFDITQVKLQIQNALTKIPFNENKIIDSLVAHQFGEFFAEISNVRQLLVQKGQYWAMYVLPNGKFETTICDSSNDIQSYIQTYKEIEQLIGGKTITYEDHR